MRWTALLVALIFVWLGYTELNAGQSFFGFYYLGAAFFAFLGFRGRIFLTPSLVFILVGLGALVWLWPRVNAGEAMFATRMGQQFIEICLVEVWMTSALVDYFQANGWPFGSNEADDQDELDSSDGGENATLDSEQP